MAEEGDIPAGGAEEAAAPNPALRGIDPAEVDNYKKVLNDVVGKSEELYGIQARNVAKAREVLNLLSQEGTLQKEISAQEVEKSKLLQKSLELKKQAAMAGTAGASKQLQQNSILLQNKQAEIEALKKTSAHIRGQEAEYKKLTAATEKHAITGQKGSEVQRSSILSLNDALINVSKQKEKGQQVDIFSKEGLRAMAETAKQGPAAIKGILDQMEGGDAAILAMLGPGAISAFLKKLKQLPMESDTALKSMAQGGIKYTKDLHDAFVGVQDPAFMQRQGILSAKQSKQMLMSIGITAKDAASAYGALKNDVTVYGDAINQSDSYTKMYTANTIAGLKKLGVPQKNSTKAFQQMTKVLFQAPKEANKSLRKLINVADSLDKNVGQVIQEFGATMPQLAQWGEGAIDIFADLEAQSAATGLSIGELNNVASKLDTFEGAADAAQKFNAVMGGTFLSVTDLVHAEPDEKINMIREAMDRSGQSFETAGRRVKSMIADMFTGGDVAQAAKLFGDENDFKLAKKNLDDTEMSTQALAKRIGTTLNVGQQMTKGFSNMAGGMDQLSGRAQSFGQNMGDAMMAANTEMIRAGQGSEMAAAGMLAGAEISAAAINKTQNILGGKEGGKAAGAVGTAGGFAALIGAAGIAADALGLIPEGVKDFFQKMTPDTAAPPAPSPGAVPPPPAPGDTTQVMRNDVFRPQTPPGMDRRARGIIESAGMPLEEVVKTFNVPPTGRGDNAALMSSISELASALRAASESPVEGTITVTDASTRENIINAAIEGSVDIIAGKLSITGMA